MEAKQTKNAFRRSRSSFAGSLADWADCIWLQHEGDSSRGDSGLLPFQAGKRRSGLHPSIGGWKTGLRELSYYEMDGKLYLTATTTRFPLFSASESAQSGWIVHTRDTGIQQIVYQGQGAQLPVWDANAQVELADSQTERRIEGMEKLEDLGSDALLKISFKSGSLISAQRPRIWNCLALYGLKRCSAPFPSG